jgi:hypothetical protein
MKTIKIDFSDEQTKKILIEVIAERLASYSYGEYEVTISEELITGAIKEAVQRTIQGQMHEFQKEIKARIKSLIDGDENFITVAMVRKAMEPYIYDILGRALPKPLKDKIKNAVLGQIQNLDVSKS